MQKTVLCVDSQTLNHPEAIGLIDENLVAQPWLRVFSSAADVRKALGSDAGPSRIWVVSSDDMEGINLAAALKGDRIGREVDLISFGGTGSEVGRCEAAGVGLVRGLDEFLDRYSEQKRLWMAESAGKAVCGNPGLNAVGRSNMGGFRKIADIPLEEPEGAGFGFDCLAEEESVDPYVSSGIARDDGGSFVDSAPRTAGGFLSVSTGCVSSAEPGAAMRKTQEELISQAVFRQPQSEESAFVVSVVGGCGGVGKSTVAVSLATMAQSRGLKTLLLDADLQFGDMGFLLGMEDGYDIADLMAQPERLTQVEPKDGLPALIRSPRKLEQSELIMGRLAEFICCLKGSFDLVVVNTGAFWSESHMQVIEASDKVLFMLDQRPSSVRSCSHALELCERCGIATQQFLFVLNFCSRHALLTSIDVSCALHGVHVEELRDGGKEVGELLGAGLPRDLMASKNAFVVSLERLLATVVPDGARTTSLLLSDADTAPKRSFFDNFKRRRAACL